MQIRHLVWIEARSRSTGLIEAAGFWNGIDVRSFDIGGVTRAYSGAGTLLGISPIIGEVGLQVRMQQVTLSRLPSEVVQLIHGYDARLAPIEVHRVFFDPQKGVPIGDPVRVMKGWVDEMPVPSAAEGGTENVTVTVASASRALTKTLTVKKSDEAQRRINATDRGREYAAISGAVGVFWGVKNARATPPPTTTVPDGEGQPTTGIGAIFNDSR
ncbi:hypothetical protein JQW89_05565 [Sulfitobacter pseudonitzschiae]|nr:hypothetical protein [Pseudosulfitobacter pseudonitzschiae]MBM2238152.1 hypothetical protein [Pseudosulfitobacter pseudonitzschiae]MBM2271936.1 hypothetical protein [Pseudosulfitobacter pseudonitzschiae]